MPDIGIRAAGKPGVPLPVRPAPAVPVVALGFTLATFFLITYVLCILFYLVFPDVGGGHAILRLFLPGFELLSWPDFFLGLVESFVLGWYVALILGPLYNVFAARLG